MEIDTRALFAPPFHTGNSMSSSASAHRLEQNDDDDDDVTAVQQANGQDDHEDNLCSICYNAW